MKTAIALTELESRAVAALTSLLGRLSAIRIQQIDRQSSSSGQSAAIFARILVFGHSHTLACRLSPHAEPARLRAALSELDSHSASLPVDTTPVLIAPSLSHQAQALLKEHRAGFLDLEGNARLTVGEIFIGMRSLPARAAAQPSAAHHKLPDRFVTAPKSSSGLHKSSRNHAVAALPA